MFFAVYGFERGYDRGYDYLERIFVNENSIRFTMDDV